MVNDSTPTPHDDDAPQPFDVVTLIPGNSAGVTTETLLLVADCVEHAPGVIELYRLADDPGHQDWAAAVTIADVATITRTSGGIQVRHWSPVPATDPTPGAPSDQH